MTGRMLYRQVPSVKVSTGLKRAEQFGVKPASIIAMLGHEILERCFVFKQTDAFQEERRAAWRGMKQLGVLGIEGNGFKAAGAVGSATSQLTKSGQYRKSKSGIAGIQVISKP